MLRYWPVTLTLLFVRFNKQLSVVVFDFTDIFDGSPVKADQIGAVHRVCASFFLPDDSMKSIEYNGRKFCKICLFRIERSKLLTRFTNTVIY